MHKSLCFWESFGRDRVKESLKLLKSAAKCFSPIFSSFLAKLNYQKSFLVWSENLGLVVNTLTANYESCRNNTDNLPIPVEMELSGKLKTFSKFFYYIFWFCIKFWNFWKKHKPHSLSISEVIHSEKRLYLNA